MAKKKRKKSTAFTQRANDPVYMVQVSEPKMLRKDILESLREVIVFMQGYEKFRKIQEEKIAIFTALKSDVKEITGLVDGKLKKYFPKGKLSAVVTSPKPRARYSPEQPRYTAPVRATQAPQPGIQRPPTDELDELEGQLKDIESQLKGIS
jgi:hypothetical protein